MLVRRLKVTGLLSFGPTGIDLPMEPLNVLVGPNGSGKSNFLEVLGLLRAAPRDLDEPFRRRGGVREWLWKGEESHGVATVETIIECSTDGERLVKYALEFTADGGGLHVAGEELRSMGAQQPKAVEYHRRNSELQVVSIQSPGTTEARTDLRKVKLEESILSQLRDPIRHPALHWLQEQYERIRLYRNWSFGPFATLRQDQSAHAPSDFLNDGAENLAVVLSHFRGREKRRLVEALHELFDGIVDVSCPVTGGTVALFLEECGGRQIPATLLSDGTLRYLSLLAVLLHPSPPPLVALEEPELGLHPDVVAAVAKLLVQASERMQIVVTTHSRMLVDALTNHPSSIVVCEKENGESRFERLDGAELKGWLDKYSLGELWSSGELGGNRW